MARYKQKSWKTKNLNFTVMVYELRFFFPDLFCRTKKKTLQKIKHDFRCFGYRFLLLSMIVYLKFIAINFHQRYLSYIFVFTKFHNAADLFTNKNCQ